MILLPNKCRHCHKEFMADDSLAQAFYCPDCIKNVTIIKEWVDQLVTPIRGDEQKDTAKQ